MGKISPPNLIVGTVELITNIRKKNHLLRQALNLKTEEAWNELKAFSAVFKKLIKEKKFELWKKLCKTSEHYYDLPFKITFNKLRKKPPFEQIKLTSGEFTKDSEETISAMFDQFIKKDNCENETFKQARMRIENLYSTVNRESDFTVTELTEALKSSKQKVPPVTI